MYYMEVLFPKLLIASEFYSDLEHAQLFLIPHYATNVYHDCVFHQLKPTDECKKRTGDYLDAILSHIQQAYPYFNASGGTDHILVFTWDQASEIVGWNHPVRSKLNRAIHLTTLGTLNDSGNFNPHKDIVIPPFANMSKALRMYPTPMHSRKKFMLNPAQSLIKLLASSLDTFWFQKQVGWDAFTSVKKSDRFVNWLERPRKTWAYFRGTILSNRAYSHGVRQYFAASREDASWSRIEIHHEHSPLYWEELGDVVFSLCPSGWSPWSPRLFDSIMTASIPVVFADGTMLPFESMIDYRSFTIKLSNDKVDSLPALLDTISPEEIQKKKNIMVKLRRHFVWNDPPLSGDAFYMTMQQLALKASPFKYLGNDEFK